MKGEFEKRIKKMEETSTYPLTCDAAENIYLLIDEARKECPRVGDTDKSTYPHEYVAIEEWIGKVEKWFGNGEKR